MHIIASVGAKQRYEDVKECMMMMIHDALLIDFLLCNFNALTMHLHRVHKKSKPLNATLYLGKKSSDLNPNLQYKSSNK